MNQYLAQTLSRQLGISLEQVVREEHEILILREMMESVIGSALVFKGGTALRLAYGSPRFSDDLDFSLLAAVTEEEFRRMVEATAKALPEVDLVEALSKQFTLFALFRVRTPFLTYPFSIKVEMSTRLEPTEPKQRVELRLLTSPTTPISVLAKVSSLDWMWADKQEAFARRKQPRDLYDLWFIAQKLQLPFTPDLEGVNPESIKRELHKYLPAHQWPLIEAWTR